MKIRVISAEHLKSISGFHHCNIEKITKNNLIAGQKGFLFTPAHYLNPIGMAVFRQTASDQNDFTSSVVYQNPGWKIEGDTGAQPVE